MSGDQVSLFPCVLETTTQSSTPSTVSWLQNSSFPEHLVSKINQASSAPKCQAVPAAPKDTQHHIKQSRDKKRKERYSPHQKKKNKKKHKKNKISERVEKFQTFELLFKGDKDNYRYGTLYACDIPVYKLFIQCCIGDLTVRSLPKKLSKQGGGANDYRYYSHLSPPQLSLQYRSKFLRLDADYISLTVSSQCWEEIDPDSRVDDPTKTDPKNVDLWLKFIDSTGTTKVGLERRYTICEKALKHLPNDIEVMRKKIHTAQLFMSNTQIGRVWTDLLFYHPNKLELWLDYLEYKQNTLSELNHTSVLAAYRKCFATMFGFHRNTFRSHTFEGNIEHALIKIASCLVRYLLEFGYTEQAVAYHVSLVELGTSPTGRTQDDYLAYWRKDCVLLGYEEYCGWWTTSNVTSRVTELDTCVCEGEDIWAAWVREERRKEEMCTGPLSAVPTDDTIDRDCCVSSTWLSPLLFTSSHPLLLLVSLFRSYLPAHIRHLPLVVLVSCELRLSEKYASFICTMCKQLYSRYSTAEQTEIGVIWILMSNKMSAGSTPKLIKQLLKDPSHRNNIVYWVLYAHYLTHNADTILSKLSASPLSSYYKLVLTNRLRSAGVPEQIELLRRLRAWDGEVEELLGKRQTSTPETLMLGSLVINTFCRSYTVRVATGNMPSNSPDNGSNNYLVDFLTSYMKEAPTSLPEQQQADLFVLFSHVIRVEESPQGDIKRCKMVALAAVELFPHVDRFWGALEGSVKITQNLWTRLLKVDHPMIWYRRITTECLKQAANPDVNLINKILSLSVSALEKYPKSLLLWEQYITNTKLYSANSLKGAIVRAIKENPASKSFYLSGVELCQGEEESLYQLIEEKQMRLRVLVEEVQMYSMGL